MSGDYYFDKHAMHCDAQKLSASGSIGDIRFDPAHPVTVLQEHRQNKNNKPACISTDYYLTIEELSIIG